MIGLFIHPMDFRNESRFNPLVYHRLSDMSVLEMTIENMLKSAHVHKVFVLLPRDQQRNITGVKYGNPPILNAYRQGLNRPAIFEYYDGYLLDALHRVSLQAGLDTIIRVSGLSPFLPPWLINDTAKEYQQNSINNLCCTDESYGDGFYLEMMPFWYLADQFVISEERNYINSYQGYRFQNKKPRDIPSHDSSFIFDDIAKSEIFEHYALSIKLGSDIADLIEEQ